MSNIYHFAVTDIQYLVCGPGVTVVITTDTPCHLHMRWTNQLPLVHLDPYIRRGAAVGTRPRFCFDLYHDNEQFETGDSITHTFIKPGWSCCETRYFYFWGCKFGYLMPSESCIFEYHNPFNAPQWLECPLYQSPAYYRATDISWSVVQTKNPISHHLSTGEQTKTTYDGGDYDIVRAAIIWDTSLVPIGSHICEAYMHRYGFNQDLVPPITDFYYYWIPYNSWSGTPQAADYAVINSLTPIIAQRWCTALMSSRTWYDIPLLQAGLDTIIKGGLTKFAAVTDRDYTNVNPGISYRRFYWYGISASHPQKLHIRYCSPC